MQARPYQVQGAQESSHSRIRCFRAERHGIQLAARCQEKGKDVIHARCGFHDVRLSQTVSPANLRSLHPACIIMSQL